MQFPIAKLFPKSKISRPLTPRASLAVSGHLNSALFRQMDEVLAAEDEKRPQRLMKKVIFWAEVDSVKILSFKVFLRVRPQESLILVDKGLFQTPQQVL